MIVRILSWKPVEIVTALPREECLRRLRNALGARWSLNFSKPVVGWTDGRKLRMRKRIWYGNSFQAILAGTMSDDGTGTRIHCKIRVNRLAQIFFSIWLSGVFIFSAVFAVSAIVSLVRHDGPVAENLEKLAFLVLFIGFAAGLVSIGRWLARDEPRFLIEYLTRTLEAQVVEGSRD